MISLKAFADKDSKLCSFSAGKKKNEQVKNVLKTEEAGTHQAELVDFSRRRSEIHRFDREKQPVAQLLNQTEFLSKISSYRQEISDAFYLKLENLENMENSGRLRSLLLDLMEVDVNFVNEAILTKLQYIATDPLVERLDTKSFIQSLYPILLKKFSFAGEEKFPDALRLHILDVIFAAESLRDSKNTNLILKIYSMAPSEAIIFQADAHATHSLKILLDNLGGFTEEMAIGVFSGLSKQYSFESLEILFQGIDGQLAEGAFSAHVSKERVLSLFSKALEYANPEFSKEKILERSFYAVEDMLLPVEFFHELEVIHDSFLEHDID
ncbi:MAG: hypothetical protein VX642_11415 [Bdellovibrionota bacterium]|nr:hypothetical protein [Bdellovibrionota bacterium]